jgi:DNA-binding transcriptional LysR family regulator
VAEVVGLEAGRLDLVCLPTLAVHPTATLIGRFRRAHPAVAVRVAEPEDADQVAERVRQGTSEIGLAELPLRDSELSTHVSNDRTSWRSFLRLEQTSSRLTD